MQLDVDKADIEILFMLYTKDKITPLYSWQIKTFLDNFKTVISYNTLVRRIQKLVEKGFLLQGYKDRNAKTYYLSEKGIDFIKNDIIIKEEISVDVDRIKVKEEE